MRLLLPLILGGILFCGEVQAVLQVEFHKHVLPIFRAKCFDCHRAPYMDAGKLKKPKSGVRLDAARAIAAGGDDGPFYVPGNPEDSIIFEVCALPPGSDDIMPPPNKGEPLTKRELAYLKHWILQGAKFGSWKGNEAGLAAESTVKVDLDAEPKTPKEILAMRITEAPPAALAPFKQAGASLTPISSDSPLLRVEFINNQRPITDKLIGQLHVLANNIAELDLSDTELTDNGAEVLQYLPRLTHLDMHGTKVTDKALGYVQELRGLEYLNLYNTEVSNDGMDNLKKLKRLKNLYVWKTKVTDSVSSDFSTTAPDLQINYGTIQLEEPKKAAKK